MARQIGILTKGISPDGDFKDVSKIVAALQAYSKTIEPWAVSVGRYMLADVVRRDLKQWRAVSKEIGRGIRQEIESAPTGAFLQESLNRQVGLIKSLPLEAAKRVHEMTLSGLVDGRRAAEISKAILATGEVTEARARLIARTEVARTATGLTEARSRAIGSDGYIWRTSGDKDVRDSHAEMEGKYIRWAVRPRLKDGFVAHAGETPNCRCWCEPVLPDFD